MNKKKVGIITLSASDNCGSLLQTYALQYVLEKKMNCCVEVINFCSKQSAAVYDIFPPFFFKHPKKTIFTLKHLKSIKNQKQDYEDFRKEYLNLTKKIYTDVDELKTLYDTYDVIITGSDQVWNINMTDYSDAFFIPWNTKAKKIAYAASLGSVEVIGEEKRSQIENWLSDFEAISVREETGKRTIQHLTNKEISILADPTLLLTFDEWNEISGERLISGEYIFFYSWSYPDEDMNELVRDFARSNKLDVYVINSSKWYKYRPEKFGFRLCHKAGPSAFINLMINAKYVFVQSFHGAVFGNLLHKRFFFLNERSDGSLDFRAANILGLLHEESQIVHSIQDIDSAMKANLNYSNDEYEALKEKSLQFLMDIVGTT